MKKKEKDTFSSTSMKSKPKQKISTIFLSKRNTENVKNFLKVKNKDFVKYDITTDHVFKSYNLTPVTEFFDSGLTIYRSIYLTIYLLSTDKYFFKY